jgi:hypothetical protein
MAMRQSGSVRVNALRESGRVSSLAKDWAFDVTFMIARQQGQEMGTES